MRREHSFDLLRERLVFNSCLFFTPHWILYSGPSSTLGKRRLLQSNLFHFYIYTRILWNYSIFFDFLSLSLLKTLKTKKNDFLRFCYHWFNLSEVLRRMRAFWNWQREKDSTYSSFPKQIGIFPSFYRNFSISFFEKDEKTTLHIIFFVIILFFVRILAKYRVKPKKNVSIEKVRTKKLYVFFILS